MEIRKFKKDIPAFVMSGYADDSIMRCPNEHGFADSISKPFTTADLSRMLSKHMPSLK
jgi:CheY-like chemotaxis protein